MGCYVLYYPLANFLISVNSFADSLDASDPDDQFTHVHDPEFVVTIDIWRCAGSNNPIFALVLIYGSGLKSLVGGR